MAAEPVAGRLMKQQEKPSPGDVSVEIAPGALDALVGSGGKIAKITVRTRERTEVQPKYARLEVGDVAFRVEDVRAAPVGLVEAGTMLDVEGRVVRERVGV